MRIYLKAIVYGLLSSFFFAFNFILIRSMNIGGGFFLWSASLRYFFTLPLLFILLIKNRAYTNVIRQIEAKPVEWLVWSTVGFGLFYAPLSAASVFGESWFTAAIWQFTIVAGVLLTPLFGKKIPVKNLVISAFTVIGILLMQLSKIKSGVQANWFLLIICMIIATFSYPLGNRKMMEIVGNQLTSTQRVFGMTLCSMPFWVICSIYSLIKVGLPSLEQCYQSFLVALLAGVIATVLFFHSTLLVKNNPRQLAVVEATQSGEVVFTLLLSIIILDDNRPDIVAFIGLIIIIVSMLLNSLVAASKNNNTE